MVSQLELRRRQGLIGQPRKPTTVTRVVRKTSSPDPPKAPTKDFDSIARDKLSRVSLRGSAKKTDVSEFEDPQVIAAAIKIAKQKEKDFAGRSEAEGFRNVVKKLEQVRNKKAIAAAAGITVGELRVRERTSLARERAFEKRKEEAKKEVVAQDGSRVVDLNKLAKEKKTAKELFKVLDNPDVGFIVERKDLSVAVREPQRMSVARVPASFEDPEVIASRRAALEKSRQTRIEPGRGDISSTAVVQDIRESLQDFSKTRIGEPSFITVGRLLSKPFERSKETIIGSDLSLERQTIKDKGGFSKEGFAAQVRSFRSGIRISGTKSISEPVDRLLLGVSVVAPQAGKFLKSSVDEVIEAGTTAASIRRRGEFIEAGASGTAAGFTASFFSSQQEGTFGEALGLASPFIAGSLVTPVTRAVISGSSLTKSISTPVLTDKAGRLGGKRGTRGRKPKSLVQRSKESRNLISNVDNTRIARLQKKAVAQARNNTPVIVDVISSPGRTSASASIPKQVPGKVRIGTPSGPITVFFKDKKPKPIQEKKVKPVKIVELLRLRKSLKGTPKQDKFFVVDSPPRPVANNVRLTKRQQRRLRGKEQGKVESAGGLVSVLETPKTVSVSKKIVKEEKKTRVNSDKGLGFIRGAVKLGEKPSNPLNPSKTKPFIQETEVRRGFRAGQEAILKERLAVKKESLEIERAITTAKDIDFNIAKTIPTAVTSDLANKQIQPIVNNRVQDSIRFGTAAVFSVPTVKSQDLFKESTISSSKTQSFSAQRFDSIVDNRLDITSLSKNANVAASATQAANLAALEQSVSNVQVTDSVFSPNNFISSPPKKLFETPKAPSVPRKPRTPSRPSFFVPSVPRKPRTPSRPRKPSKPIEPKLPNGKKGSEEKDFNILGMSKEEFAVFLKERGKFREIGRGSRAKAISIGSEAALSSLAATFQLRKTGRSVRVGRKRPVPDTRDLFREFKIRQGKKVSTPDTFIQKRSKRLTTRKEVSAIQRARINKSASKSNKNSLIRQNRKGVVL